MRERIYQAGSIIVREGESGNCMYRILEGCAAVYANHGTPEQKLLTTLGVGDFFGEMAILEACPRSATVTAREDTRLEEISSENLDDFLRASDDNLLSLTKHLSRRLRDMTGEYTAVCDALREWGQLDMSIDRLNDGLLSKIKRFASVYLLRKGEADRAARQEDDGWKGRHVEGFVKRPETYSRGDVIFREGEKASCMYIIQEGRVGIYSAYDTPKQKLLTVLTQDMLFGEMGLIEHMPRSAAAVAVEDDTCVEALFANDLPELFEKNPAKVHAILQHLSYRLRRLTKDYLKACKAFAEAEMEIELSNRALTPEARAQMEYMNQMLLMPEVMY